MPRLFADVAGTEPTVVDEALQFLRSRYPDSAPFVVRYPTQYYRNYQRHLENEAVRFRVVAGFAFLLAGIGISTVLSLNVRSRRHEYAVHRVCGAAPHQIRRYILSTCLAQGLLVAFVGFASGAIALECWTRRLSYPPVFPTEWILGGAGISFALALVIGFGIARQVLGRAPYAELRGGD